MAEKSMERPFAVLSYVARQFLNMSIEEWDALGDEEKKKHVQSANRALHAAQQHLTQENIGR